LQKIDDQAEIRDLLPQKWEHRYALERDLEQIYLMEESYWKQRARKHWLLAGDSNSKFFHQFANGRRRKGTIYSIQSEQGQLTNQEDIMAHIVQFYKQLFGGVDVRHIKLSTNFWTEDRKLSEANSLCLIKAFSMEEIKQAIFDMKQEAAPGPNGYGASFLQHFWESIKDNYHRMFVDFYNGDLDIKRLNYGVITLVPKVKDAITIKQYRPICLLNVDYKGFTKVLTERLTPVAKEVTGFNQTGFIQGRNILEGVVILHEVIHELSHKKKKGLILKNDFEKAYDRVRWDFLEEVLQGKRFPPKWIQWVMQMVQGGWVCVNVNGTRGPYFRTLRGLRQGDPLSPLLFNLVADSLSAMLDKAVSKHLIRGVVEHLVPDGISHIQYVDDTVIMIDGSDNSITNLKILLYCFEWLSGLKINYHKSEVILFGFNQEDKERKANMLNCRLGELPIKYLGIPISNTVLGMGAFQGVLNKMIKRLDPWKGKHMTSGGRLILTNSCLSSLPMYVMGFYSLPKGLHCKMDTIRSSFFWRGADDVFKYHMAKWISICKPKIHGGLGIINTEIMNQCLLTKWIWKIEAGSTDLWCRLVKAKYMHSGNFFCSDQKGTSQFWSGLHKVKHMFKWGAEYRVFKGDKIRFWQDLWIGNTPLNIQYSSLYEISNNQQDLVCDVWDGDDWSLSFRRNLHGVLIEDWMSLQQLLGEVQLDISREDSVRWVLDKSFQYTTKSLYQLLTHGGG
jgi:hypothetical protein